MIPEDLDLSFLREKEQELFKSLFVRDQSEGLSSDELIELGSLYIGLECEEQAFEVYEKILRKDTHNAQAKFWYSHFLLIYRAPFDSTDKEKISKYAEYLINQSGETIGMGYSIRARYLSKLYYPKTTIEEIYAWCQSIHFCPDWSLNYVCLASKLEKDGVFSEALKLYEKARENCNLEFDTDWSPTKSYFEGCITARVRNTYSNEDVVKRIGNLKKRINEETPREKKRSIFALFKREKE